MSTAGDDDIVPDESLVTPAPTTFTHELRKDTPFRYVSGGDARRASHGVLAAGTHVLLMGCDRDDCRVVDPSGLHVVVRRDALRPLGPTR